MARHSCFLRIGCGASRTGETWNGGQSHDVTAARRSEDVIWSEVRGVRSHCLTETPKPIPSSIYKRGRLTHSQRRAHGNRHPREERRGDGEAHSPEETHARRPTLPRAAHPSCRDGRTASDAHDVGGCPGVTARRASSFRRHRLRAKARRSRPSWAGPSSRCSSGNSSTVASRAHPEAMMPGSSVGSRFGNPRGRMAVSLSRRAESRGIPDRCR
jgi:hypothetical protein